MSNILDDFLEHAGVKGMKWGVRKSRRSPSSDASEVKTLKKKKRYELSNAELKRVNERLQLEKKLKDLNPSSVKRGKTAVTGVIAAAGSAAALYNLVKSPAGQAAIATGKKFITNAEISLSVLK